jgi:hypothetical protein
MATRRAPRKIALPPVQAADLRGIGRLATDATVGVVDLVEAMHHTIRSLPGIVGEAPQGQARGLTGLVYRTVRGTARLSGRAVDLALGLLPERSPQAQRSPQREAVLAALNGVFGDHLAATANPLALPSSLRWDGQLLATVGRAVTPPVALPHNPRLVLLAHGLCMNDLQWQRQGHDHGQALAQALGYCPVYLHYNSGRHVSQNGADLAELLSQLLALWPVPVQELVLLGHSMGGLVARSACHQAAQTDAAWLQPLTHLLCLGTPHHGAPLERGGRLVDTLFDISPYAAPFGRLGRARSAGITDLRYGNLQAADWEGRDRHAQRHDDRQPTPLPAGVFTGLVAAVLGDAPARLSSSLAGDGLVPLKSALGLHRQTALALQVPEDRRLVVTEANHWDLLNRAEVFQQLQAWLAPPGG